MTFCSTGMFSMTFEDSDGNRLSIPGEITITIPQETIGNSTDSDEVKVWTLNPAALSKATGLSAAAAEAQRKSILQGEAFLWLCLKLKV